jgi:hypothetical protein
MFFFQESYHLSSRKSTKMQACIQKLKEIRYDDSADSWVVAVVQYGHYILRCSLFAQVIHSPFFRKPSPKRLSSVACVPRTNVCCLGLLHPNLTNATNLHLKSPQGSPSQVRGRHGTPPPSSSHRIVAPPPSRSPRATAPYPHRAQKIARFWVPSQCPRRPVFSAAAPCFRDKPARPGRAPGAAHRRVK